jgi:P27 family predicted phage terminase small subunit
MTEEALFHGLPVPNLGLILDDPAEVDEAMRAWRRVVISMWEAETLTAVNAPLVQQLVIIYALYERAVREVAANGAILKPKKGSTRAIARISPHFTAMCKLSTDALAIESALGLTPRSRGKVTKRARGRGGRPSASDEFLGKGFRLIDGGRPGEYPPPPKVKPRRGRD